MDMDSQEKKAQNRWQGRGGGSEAESGFGEEKNRSAVNSVDIGDNFREWRWCEHVRVKGTYLEGMPVLTVEDIPQLMILRRGGIEYLTCGTCFLDYMIKLKSICGPELKRS